MSEKSQPLRVIELRSRLPDGSPARGGVTLGIHQDGLEINSWFGEPGDEDYQSIRTFLHGVCNLHWV